MCPTEVSDDAVIIAGDHLRSLCLPVTGYALRKTIGKGTPARLMAVWDGHIGHAIDPSSPTPEHDLPLEIEDTLKLFQRQQGIALRAIAQSLLKASNRAAEPQISTLQLQVNQFRAEHAAEISASAAALATANTEHQVHVDLLTEQSLVMENLVAQLKAQAITDQQTIAHLRDSETDLKRKLVAIEQTVAIDATARAVELQTYADLKAAHQHLTIANNAVCDQSNERHTLLRIADEKIKVLSDRIVDLLRAADAQRIELNRSWQSMKTLESAHKALQTRADLLEQNNAKLMLGMTRDS